MREEKKIWRFIVYLSAVVLCFIALSVTEVEAACSHPSVGWVTAVQPTCASKGRRDYICQRCGTVFNSADLDKVPSHSFNRSSASCTEDKVCSVCGYVAQSRTGHSMTWVTVSNPTCTSEGYRDYKCSKCGVVTNSASIGRVSHSPNMSSASCTEDKRCTMCGCVLQSKTGHHYSDQYYTKAPTCNAGGAMLQKCSGCGETKIVQVGPTGKHNYKAESTNATCTQPGSSYEICTVCKLKRNVTNTNPLGHLFDESNYTVTKAPSATETGAGVCRCKRSGCDATRTITIPATGKVEPEDPCKNGHTNSGQLKKQAATCENDGWQISICSRCGAELGQKAVLKALGHRWDSGKLVKSDSVYNYYEYHCLNSGCSEIKSIKETITAENSTAGAVAGAETGVKNNPCTNGHISNGAPTTIVNPTCKTTGIKVLLCSRCGVQLGEQIVIPKREHNWSEGVFISSDNKVNRYQYHCLYSDCNATKTEEIAVNEDSSGSISKDKPTIAEQKDPSGCKAGNHQWTDYVERSVATCKTGAVFTRNCTVPGCNAVESYIGPVGTHVLRKVDVPSTCQTKGYTANECVFCNRLFSVKEKKIGKHKYTGWTCIQKETCYLNGRYSRYCTVCNHYDYKIKNKLEHEAKSKLKVQKSTCVTAGYKVEICKNCGKEMGDRITLKLASHKVNWITHTDSSTGKVTLTGTCSVCQKQFIKDGKKGSKAQEVTSQTPAPLNVHQCSFVYERIDDDHIRIYCSDPTCLYSKPKQVDYNTYHKKYAKKDPNVKNSDPSIQAILELKTFYSASLGTDDDYVVSRYIFEQNWAADTEAGRTIKNGVELYQNYSKIVDNMKNSTVVDCSYKITDQLNNFFKNEAVNNALDSLSKLDGIKNELDGVSEVFTVRTEGQRAQAILNVGGDLIGVLPVVGDGYSEVYKELGVCTGDILDKINEWDHDMGGWLMAVEKTSDNIIFTSSLEDIADAFSEDGSNNEILTQIYKECGNDLIYSIILEERFAYEMQNIDIPKSQRQSFYDYFFDRYKDKARY